MELQDLFHRLQYASRNKLQQGNRALRLSRNLFRAKGWLVYQRPSLVDMVKVEVGPGVVECKVDCIRITLQVSKIMWRTLRVCLKFFLGRPIECSNRAGACGSQEVRSR